MKKLVIAALLALALFTACAADEGAPDVDTAETTAKVEGAAVRTITADEGAAKMNEGGVLVIDVRRSDEYAEGHIPGAINIPDGEIGEEHPDGLAEHDAALIIYCRSGNRSRAAAERLIAAGYTEVYDMGGILDWPYETAEGDEPGEYKPVELPETDGILSSFSTVDIYGNAVDQSILADYELTMVNIWATYCSPCLREMPDLGELAAEYSDKGVQITGLVSDTLTSFGSFDEKQVELAVEIVEKTSAAYTHLLPSGVLQGILSQIYAVPTTFFVNSRGEQTGDVVVGSRSREEWVEIIESRLSEVRS